MELAEKGSLLSWVQQQRSVVMPQVISFATQIAAGMVAIHNASLVHGVIEKPFLVL